MPDVRGATRAVVEETPVTEGDLEAVLAVDADADGWTFDDVPVDSGKFGELVGRGIVEETADGDYAVADREAVAAALTGTPAPAGDDAGLAAALRAPSRDWLPAIDPLAAAALAVALALVVAVRLLPYPAVFRNGDVVLSSNDPYYYRYLVERLAARAAGPLDAGALAQVPAPDGEPLLVATLWWATELLGGGAQAAGLVLAWYPPATAVITGVVLYLLAVRVTDDRRVGVAAVLLLAVTPIHATRTGVGFADHHAFDFVWLAATALALVAVEAGDRRVLATWGWAALLGVGVAGQTMAWEAGPLLLVPVGAYLAVRVVVDVRDGTAPATAHAPTVAGLGLGAALSYAVHAGVGWHTPTVAYAPLGLVAGAAGVIGVAELISRRGGPAGVVAAAELAGAFGALGVAVVVFPSGVGALRSGIAFLVGTGGISETVSLFNPRAGGIAAPVLYFGFGLLVAVPYMGWLTWRVSRGDDPRWLAPLVYGWAFFLLALLQVRFGGELALFAALFAGYGLVHLAAVTDLARPPVTAADAAGADRALALPGRRDALRLASLTLAVGGVGALLSRSATTISDSQYRAARVMRRHAREQGWAYPRSYVFCEWSWNRFYNYFVNGRARSYAFAEANYGAFVASRSPADWRAQLVGRTGFVLVSLDDVKYLPKDDKGTMFARLFGENAASVDWLEHIHTTADGTKKVFVVTATGGGTGDGDDGGDGGGGGGGG